MPRTLKINQTYRRILHYLARGDSTAFILKNVKINRRNYYKKLDLLAKHGYISKKRAGRILNIEVLPGAFKEFTKPSVGTQSVHYQGPYINIHHVWYSCPFLKKPQKWGPDYVERILEAKGVPYTTNKVKNWRSIFFDFSGITVRVTTRKVLLMPPPMSISIRDTPEHAKNLMLEQVMAVIPKIERWFSISLLIPNRASITVSSQHIAFVKNEFAKYFADKGIDLRVYDEEGRLRAIVDKSRGPELEFIDKTHAEDDADKMQSFIQDIYTGGYEKQQQTTLSIVQGLAQNQEALSGDLTAYGREIAAHVQAIKDLGAGVKKLTDLIKKLKETQA